MKADDGNWALRTDRTRLTAHVRIRAEHAVVLALGATVIALAGALLNAG